MPLPQTSYAERSEYPEYERRRAGEFQNGSGPEGGYDPALVNTEVHISLARRAGDSCAADYFKVKLWQGIVYMHHAAKVPARFRIAWDQGAGEEELRALALPSDDLDTSYLDRNGRATWAAFKAYRSA